MEQTNILSTWWIHPEDPLIRINLEEVVACQAYGEGRRDQSPWRVDIFLKGGSNLTLRACSDAALSSFFQAHYEVLQAYRR